MFIPTTIIVLYILSIVFFVLWAKTGSEFLSLKTLDYGWFLLFFVCFVAATVTGLIVPYKVTNKDSIIVRETFFGNCWEVNVD